MKLATTMVALAFVGRQTLPSSNGLQYMLFEERCRPIRRRQEEHKNLLRPLKRRLEGLHLPWRIAVLALILTASLTALMDRTHATGRGSVDAAKHHAGTRPHVTKGRVHVVKHHAGHSPRKALKRKKLRSALMPPAPTDFGPHFDFPPASLNNGPTQAPYPGW
jgi:hypothetical protein